MEAWNTLSLDQPQLKTYLSVLLKERRQEMWEDLTLIAKRSGLPPDVLDLLETNQFEANLDPYLIQAVAKGYQFTFEQMAEIVRVSCVDRLVTLVRMLDDDDVE